MRGYSEREEAEFKAAREHRNMSETTLTKIIATREANGTWSCTRIRSKNPKEKDGGGESASGLKDLEDVIDYIRAHGQGYKPEKREERDG